MPKSTRPSNKNEQQYAPWSEHEPEEEIPVMTDEEIAAATDKLADLISRKEPEPK